MPQPPPDLKDVRAVALTTCPLLAEHLQQLHPAVRTDQDAQLADELTWHLDTPPATS